MEKQIFKVGDRVFDYAYGWGKVTGIEGCKALKVTFEHIDDFGKNIRLLYNEQGKEILSKNITLSFTEYTLQGFSQERPPINYNDYIGKWGVFWDRWCNGYYISKLKEIDVNNGFTEFVDSDSGKWDKFRPLTEEQIKILKSCD